MMFPQPRETHIGNSRTTPLSDNLWPIQEEFNAFFLGRWIGGGATRSVYEFAFDPENYVIKVERPAANFCNAAEWNVWGDLQDKPAGKWLAPCMTISRSGGILIMRRTKPIEKLPKRLPSFFCDLKAENFGMLDGRLVAHDYGYHQLNLIGAKAGTKLEPV